MTRTTSILAPRPQASTRRRVLLVHNDWEEAEIVSSALGALRIESFWTRRGFEGLAAVRDARFDLLLVDVDLPDISGLDLVRTIQAEHDSTRVIVISRCVTVSIAVEAIKLGVSGVLERPIDAKRLRTGLDVALGPAATAVRRRPESVAERWAALVLKTLHAEHDPKTIASWSRAVGVSRSVLCECCRLVHVSPRDARDFARVLRAIHCSGEKWQPEIVFDLADARTLKKLLSQAGLLDRMERTPTRREFLERQQWIPKEHPGLRALQREVGLRD